MITNEMINDDLRYAVYSMSDLNVDSKAELMGLYRTVEEAKRESARLENCHEETPGYFTYIVKVLVDENEEIVFRM